MWLSAAVYFWSRCISRKLISKLSPLPGDATPLRDQAIFIASIAGQNDVVMAQLGSNTRVQALKGNLPGAVRQAVPRALTTDQNLVALVLKFHRPAMAALVDVIYDLILNQTNTDIERLGS